MVSLFSVMIAVCVCTLIFCIWQGVVMWRETDFFVAGGHSERMLLAKVNDYLGKYYPGLIDQCKIRLVHQHMIPDNKKQFRVTFKFTCQEMCHTHDKNVAFIVNVSDMNNFYVVGPINDYAIEEYKIEKD